MKKILLLLILLSMTTLLFAAGNKEEKGRRHGDRKEAMMKGNPAMMKDSPATVVEIATFKLNDGVTVEEFAKIDKALEREYIVKQPGFVARQAGATEDGQWVAIIYWESIEDAEASMASFADASPTANFMANMNPETMQMQRYTLSK